jgi:ribosomal protein L29
MKAKELRTKSIEELRKLAEDLKKENYRDDDG